MSLSRAGLVAVAVAALTACRSGPRADTATPSGGFAVTERAETGPITAIAVRPPFVWVAGAGGLRRYELGDLEAEDVASPTHAGGRGITAIAIDDDGAAWVASAIGEVGRWRDAGDAFHYESKGTPGRLSALAPRRPLASEGVWAAGPAGLFRFDGRIFNSVDALHEIPVTSLVLDDDGKSAWVGTRARGLYRAAGARAAPVPGNDAMAVDELVGVAKTAAGTRVAVGNVEAGARLFAITAGAEVEPYRAPAGVRAVALVQRGADACLIARAAGREQVYTLRPLAPAETYPPGSLHFSSVVPERATRWAGLPTGEKLPPDVRVAAASGDELVVGTARMGAARAGGGDAGPRFIPGSQLVGDAPRIYVACATRTRCTVITGGPRAWLTDGDRYEETRVGEPAEATPLALASDAQGGMYAIAVEPPPGGLAITKYSAAAAGGKGDWQPLHKVAVELPAKTTARASFAAISPANTLWVGLRAVSGDGSDVGAGAIEIDLNNGHAVQHGPQKVKARAAEALPLAASLTDVLFDSGATYYASLGGVSRWQEGELRSWGENEGLASELVHAIARGPDGAIWIATSEGLARFDGKDWRPLGTTELGVRGLAVDAKSRAWVATSKGLRMLTGASDPAAAPVVVSGEMRDVVTDRFGRVWGMTTTSIAFVDEK
jgi:hypothetical protein